MVAHGYSIGSLKRMTPSQRRTVIKPMSRAARLKLIQLGTYAINKAMDEITLVNSIIRELTIESED